jgi:triacylglycerol lipase
MRALPLLVLAFAFSFVAGCAAADTETSVGRDEINGAKSAAKPTPTQYPIVLAHGFAASPENQWGYYKVKDALVRDGNHVVEARVPPFDTPMARAKELAKFVDDALAETKAEKVNIIAHSMGGLDARVLVSGMGYGDRVASVTTISSPHHGTYVADVALKLVPDGPVTDALNGLAGLYGRTFTDRALAEQTNVRGALEAISEAGAESFNAKYPNDPRVHYYSFAGVSAKLGVGDSQDMTACEGMLDGDTDQMSPLLVPLALIVGHGFGFQKGFRPNDGMTTVESSKWGEFLGCIRADHLDEVGQIQHDGPDPRTGFDHIAFFRALVSTMGEHGY